MSVGIAAVERNRSLAVWGLEWQENTKNRGYSGRCMGTNLNPWCPEQSEKCYMLDRVAMCSVHVAMAGGCIAVGEEGGRAQLNRGWFTKTKARSCLCSRQAACNICTSLLRPVPSGCRVAALLLVQLRTRLQLLPRRCLGNAFLSCTLPSLTVGHF
jgi:hypothetical protein